MFFSLPDFLPNGAVQSRRSVPEGPDWGTVESDPGLSYSLFSVHPTVYPFLAIFSLLLENIGVKGVECKEVTSLDEQELQDFEYVLSFLSFFISFNP